jgi:AcrR family transcriptional regulator
MKSSVGQKETREAILDATDKLLSRFGYKKMTIDDLASLAGIGKGSVYLHFPSKEEIALAHIDRIIERLSEKLETIAASPEPVEKKLRDMLKTRVLHRFDSVQQYTENLNDLLSALRPKVLARREEYFATEARKLALVIAEGQRNGTLAAGDAFELGEMLVTATNSLLPFNLTAAELGGREDIEKKTTRMADLLLSGLSVR